jgi:hypothetical protein
MRDTRIRALVTYMVGLQDTLARIALWDDRFISSLAPSGAEVIQLDHKTRALAGLAALIGLSGTSASFVASVQDSQAAGASKAQIVRITTTGRRG